MSSMVVCIVLCIFLVICGRAQTDEVCLPVRKDTESTPTPQTMGMQGRPGKIGPVGVPGVPGPPGPMGPSGACTCDPQDVEELREQVQALRDEMSTLNSLSHDHLDKVTYCSVGMKNGRVRDSQISASSIWSSKYEASHGRLDNEPSRNDRGSWLPDSTRQRAGEWLQVDLLEPTRVTGVVTQGRSGEDEWITSYKIQYGNSVTALKTIKNRNGNDTVFLGNTDSNSYVIRTFSRSLVARYFRFIVQSYHRFASLRIDYVTC